jgi:hypothetical protein
MRKLALVPTQSDYSAQYGQDALSTALAGGPSRTRLDFVGSVAVVNVTWTVPPNGYSYLQAFHRSATQNETEPFLIDLILDSAMLTEYQAKFVVTSFRLAGVEGLTYSVSAQLEITPLTPDEEADGAIMDVYEAYGEDGGDTLALLAQLVNVTMPDSIPGV